ncbi:MAG: electron transport complex subunit E [Candidatus Omnitrophica bacterium]|nr:electron transport complex subunit E [Candidatus Omnitrophota bacterium]MCK5287897.1 electron transport complex subunit E [Candidatus Omnitrophota bacterium]
MKEFIKGLWHEHPVFRQLLGMCPTLAVTTSALNGISMGLSVVFVLFFSSLVVSLIKKIVPPQVRIAVYTVIIATFVTIVDIFLQAVFPDISMALGPFIPLIIVNCIILGRCEAFVSKHSLSDSLQDALGMGLGFTWGVFLLGSIRELFGDGSILGFRILSSNYNPLIVMILPAGAFIVLGFLVAIMNSLEK